MFLLWPVARLGSCKSGHLPCFRAASKEANPCARLARLFLRLLRRGSWPLLLRACALPQAGSDTLGSQERQERKAGNAGASISAGWRRFPHDFEFGSPPVWHATATVHTAGVRCSRQLRAAPGKRACPPPIKTEGMRTACSTASSQHALAWTDWHSFAHAGFE